MIRSVARETLTSLRITLLIALVCCIGYTLVVTGVAQLAFHDQANGSLITRSGRVIGSKLIGQNFTNPRYLQGRPSATVDESNPASPKPYNAATSSGSNLGPSNQALVDRVRASVADIRNANPSYRGDIPVDLVTADFSGFDPDISEAGALLQVERVAQARGLSPDRVRRVVEDHLEGRSLGVLGSPHVNVLSVNLALDDGAAG